MGTAMGERPRVLIVAMVLLVHAAVIYLFTIRVERKRLDRDMDVLSIPIRLAPLAAPAVSPEVDTVSRAPRDTVRTEELRPTVVPESRQGGAAITLPPEESGSGGSTDWTAQSELRSRNWAEANSTPGNSGNPDQGDETTDSTAPNFFKRNSPRRAGYIEMLGPGVERRWINSRCYREFGRPPDRVLGPRLDLNPTTCLVGPGPVRDDLFDHLKPDYLKDEE